MASFIMRGRASRFLAVPFWSTHASFGSVSSTTPIATSSQPKSPPFAMKSVTITRMVSRVALLLFATLLYGADDNRTLGERARQYLIDLIKLNTSNPPGNESRVAEYLKTI